MIHYSSQLYVIDHFALVAQNEILESKIQRRPSRTSGARKPDLGKPPALNLPSLVAAPSSSAIFSSSLITGSAPLSTSLGPNSSHGPQMFLRVRIADTADAVHVSTTIPVSAGMYMQEVLEVVCRKRKFPNSSDYALLLADVRLFIPLDRTVASLQGKRELLLVKKSMLPQMGVDVMKAGRTTDPNGECGHLFLSFLLVNPVMKASIFKRMSDTPEVKLSSTLDYTASYKVGFRQALVTPVILLTLLRNTPSIVNYLCLLLAKKKPWPSMVNMFMYDCIISYSTNHLHCHR